MDIYNKDLYLEASAFVLEQISNCEVPYQVEEEEAMPDYTGILKEVLVIVDNFKLDKDYFKDALSDALDCYWEKDMVLSYLVSNGAILENSFTQFSILENNSEMFVDDVENIAPDIDLFNLIVENNVSFSSLIGYCEIFEDYFEDLDVYEHEDELRELILECGEFRSNVPEDHIRSVLESCKYE